MLSIFSGIRISHHKGSSLPEVTLREMWEFRLRYMRLNPGIDPEVDYAAFAKIVRRADKVLLGRPRSGRLASMVVARAETRIFEGQRFVWIWPEFGFVDEAHRSNISYFVHLIVSLTLLQHREGYEMPAYLASIGWPSGFLSFRSYIELRLLGDPTATEWEKRMLTSLAKEMAGDAFDPEHNRVRMRVLPKHPVRTPKTASTKEGLAYYLRHNPAWNEGFGAVVYYRFPPGAAGAFLTFGEILLKRNAVRWQKALFQND